MNFFDEVLDLIEKIDPEFDRNNLNNKDIAVKCFILSIQNKEEGKDLKEKYLKEVIEETEKSKIKKLISNYGIDAIKRELTVLNFEKEILERKINIVKNFLN